MPIYPMPMPAPTPSDNISYPSSGGSGTITGATNLGAGEGVFAQVNGANLEFKSLTGTGGLTFVTTSTEIQISAAGVAFNPATSYTNLSLAGPITGNWQHVGEFNVQAGSGDVVLQSDTGTISLLAPNAGESAIITADIVSVTGANTLSLAGSTFDFASSGVTDIEAGGILNISSTAADVNVSAAAGSVYLSGDYVYGTSSGVNGIAWEAYGGPVTIRSNSSATAIIGQNVAQLVAQAGFCQVYSWTSYVRLYAPSGDIRLESPIVTLNNIANTVEANQLYYNTTTKRVTWGAVPAASADWFRDGTNTGSGLLFGTSDANGFSFRTNASNFLTVDAAGISTYSKQLQVNADFGVAATNNINISTSAASQIITLNAAGTGSGVVLDAAGFTNFNAPLVQFPNPATVVSSNVAVIQMIASNNVSFISTGASVVVDGLTGVSISSANVTMPLLPSSEQPEMLYYNSTTKQVTYGLYNQAPVQISSNTALQVNKRYQIDSGILSLSLPTTSAVGDKIHIISTPSAGVFTITQGVGQKVYLLTASTTTGVTGTTTSIDSNSSLTLQCIVANLEWSIVSSMGNFNLV